MKLTAFSVCFCFPKQNAVSPFYVRINSGTNASTSCKILVNIGPVTSEKNKLKGEICVVTRPQFDDHRSFGTLSF